MHTAICSRVKMLHCLSSRLLQQLNQITQGEKDNTVIIGSKLDAQAYDIQISEIN